MAKKNKNTPTSLYTEAANGLSGQSKSGPVNAKFGKLNGYRKSKPPAKKIGKGKGDWHKTASGIWRRRKFTAAQRKTFRSRADKGKGSVSGY